MRVFAERQVIPTIYAVGMALESIVTILVVILARLVSIVALGAVERVFRINADSPRRYPGLNQRASRYYLPLRRILSGTPAAQRKACCVIAPLQRSDHHCQPGLQLHPACRE
jgi:hypothetical protein